MVEGRKRKGTSLSSSIRRCRIPIKTWVDQVYYQVKVQDRVLDQHHVQGHGQVEVEDDLEGGAGDGGLDGCQQGLVLDQPLLHLVGQVYKVSKQDIAFLTEVVFTTQFTFASIPRMQQSSLKMWLEI